MMGVDYTKGQQAELPKQEELKTVAKLAAEQVKLENQIVVAERQLADLKAKLAAMRTEALPEAMKQLHLTEIKLDNGATVSVKDDLNCNIKADNKPAAHAWLREHGHGDIIKNDLTFSFGPGEREVCDEIISVADDRDWEYSIKEAVHAQTLNAWAKRQQEAVADMPPEQAKEQTIPEDLISVFRYSVAKVKLPKKK